MKFLSRDSQSNPPSRISFPEVTGDGAEAPSPGAMAAGRRTFRLWLGGLAVLTGAVLLIHLGVMPIWGSEGRWAVISRNMFRTGELFRPVLGTSVYWDKPLLSYWAVLPFASVLGGVSELAIRLPSVVAAFVLLFLTVDFARSGFGDRVALISGMVLSTSYGFIFWGRNGQVEMLNAAIILWAIWYFQKHRSDRGHSWFYILGSVTALGANLKGLPAFAVPGFCIAFLSLVRRDWSWLPPWRHCLGAVILTLAIYFAFPLTGRWATGDWGALKLVWQENVLRFFAPLDHKDPVWTYAVRIFDLAAPWSLLLPAAIFHYARCLRERFSAGADLLFYFAGVFLFFTLSGSRRPYYLLPVLPFASILVARLLTEFADASLPRWADRYIGLFAGLVALLGILPPVVLVARPDLIPADLSGYRLELTACALIIALAGTTMAVCCVQRKAAGMFGAVFGCWFCYVLVVPPMAVTAPNCRDTVAGLKSMNRPFAFLRNEPARVVFYLDQSSRFFHDENEAYQWAMYENGILIVQQNMSAERWKPVAEARTWSAVAAIPPLDIQHDRSELSKPEWKQPGLVSIPAAADLPDSNRNL